MKVSVNTRRSGECVEVRWWASEGLTVIVGELRKSDRNKPGKTLLILNLTPLETNQMCQKKNGELANKIEEQN